MIWIYARASFDPEDKEASVQTQANLNLNYIRLKELAAIPTVLPWLAESRMFETEKGCGIFGLKTDGSIQKLSGALPDIQAAIVAGNFLAILVIESNVRGGTLMATRPGGGVMCSLLKPGDHVVMTRSDRGFRDFKQFVDVCHNWTSPHKNITLHCHKENIIASADPDAASWFMVHLMALVAEFEKRRIRERTIEGQKEKKRRGVRYARGSGLGWTFAWSDVALEWKLVANPQELALMYKMAEWVDAGNTQKGVWKHLLDNGVKRKVLRAKPNAIKMNGHVHPRDLVWVEIPWSITLVKDAIKAVRAMRKAEANADVKQKPSQEEVA